MTDKKNGTAVLPELQKRKPFKNDEAIAAWKLCATAAIRIDKLKEDLEAAKERFEKLKDAIRAGGYLVENQGHLPLEHPDDDEAEARS